MVPVVTIIHILVSFTSLLESVSKVQGDFKMLFFFVGPLEFLLLIS